MPRYIPRVNINKAVPGEADLGPRRLRLQGREVNVQIAEAVTEATINLSMAEASTLTLTLTDPDRRLIRNRAFRQQSRLSIDGWDFVLVQIRKTGSSLEATFEHEAVRKLRAERGSITRAPGTTRRSQFAAHLIREARLRARCQRSGIETRVAIGRGGKNNKNENSWDCLHRLADEVGWRVFVNQDVVTFASDRWLFNTQDSRDINETLPAVNTIDYDCDVGKIADTATVECFAGEWDLPIGYPVWVTRHLGVAHGQWVITGISRSLFSLLCTVTLERRRELLPEPMPKEDKSEEAHDADREGKRERRREVDHEQGSERFDDDVARRGAPGTYVDKDGVVQWRRGRNRHAREAGYVQTKTGRWVPKRRGA